MQKSFNELVGEHEFSGVETGCMDYKDEFGWETKNCQYVKFTLDGTHYVAVEDPEDGYRSCCGIFQTELTPPRYSFESIKVICSMMPNEPYCNNDVLVVTDVITDKVILEIGTTDIGDWYPGFHFVWRPEDMCHNMYS